MDRSLGDLTARGFRFSFPNDVWSAHLHNAITLPRGDFTADVYEVEGEWNPTQWVSVTNQIQYDNDSEIVGLFARLRWIVRPGNDVFLVYTHNRRNLGLDILDDRDLVTLSRGGAVKVNYTYRF